MNVTSETMMGRTIRCGVFRTVGKAQSAVERLRTVGFRGDQITVLCSDESKEKHFRGYEHEEVGPEHTVASATAGGLTGVAVGGLIAAGITTATGLAILSVGTGLLLAGAVAGTFIGAMQSRGEEGALANFYDQALTQGDLLVAVEDHEDGFEERLVRAEEVLRECGAEPIPLPSDSPLP